MIDKYIEYLRTVRRYSPRTLEIYADVLKDYFGYNSGPSRHSGLDPESANAMLTVPRIRNYEVYLLEKKKDSARTVNLHLSVLSGFAKFLMKNGILASNPVKLVSRPKSEKRLPVFYRKDSLEQYFAETAHYASEENLSMLESDAKEAEKWYYRRLKRLVVILLYDTGIRRSELLSLKVSSVDVGRNVLRVCGKGDKMREIPVVSSLCEEISLYLQARDKMGVSADSPSDSLLVTVRGAGLYPVLVDRIVKEELGTVGSITGRKSPHVLRHTIATELLDEGTDLNSIKEMLGHSSLAATQVYTHNTIEKLKNVYNNAHPRAKRGGKNGD